MITIDHVHVMLWDENKYEWMNEWMDKVKETAKNLGAPVDYVFCYINCQPTIKTDDGQFMRFDTEDEAIKILEEMILKGQPEEVQED